MDEPNLIGNAEVVEIRAPETAAIDLPPPLPHPDLNFAEPDKILTMMDKLHIDPVNINKEVAEKMRSIYHMSQKQSLPLEEYLLENGRRVGGVRTEGFFDKLYVYLSLVDRENDARKDLMFASKERSMYENEGSSHL